jgi:hypothetical protein
MNSTTDNNIRANIALAALDPYLERNIVSPKETVVRGKDFVEWGDGNAYPDYLLELTKTVPTLRSIINGTVDFIVGDGVSLSAPLREGWKTGQVNMRGDTIAEQVEDLARDYETYGGYALQIIRDFAGRVAETYYIDLRFLRTNKEGDVFWYSEKWAEKGKKDAVMYPAFRWDIAEKWATMTDEERNRNASSILYVKTTHSQVYPMPVYAASVKACEIERMVDDYHLNSLENGFNPSVIINFNNGKPTDQIKEEIEEQILEKHTGAANAGRIILSWNDNKESATTFETLPITDFGDKYKALAENSREKIFTAFRAYPNIFGLSTATGFSIEEFDSAFKLYNRTSVRPVQRMIADSYEKIYGQPGILQITPFSLDGTNEKTVN